MSLTGTYQRFTSTSTIGEESFLGFTSSDFISGVDHWLSTHDPPTEVEITMSFAGVDPGSTLTLTATDAVSGHAPITNTGIADGAGNVSAMIAVPANEGFIPSVPTISAIEDFWSRIGADGGPGPRYVLSAQAASVLVTITTTATITWDIPSGWIIGSVGIASGAAGAV